MADRPERDQIMVVLNLAAFDFEFTQHGIYTCPSEREGFKASYKHYPARYAGIYINKGARFVAEVDAVIRLQSETEGQLLWKFVDRPDENLISEARTKRKGAKWERTGRVLNQAPCLVFLFGAKRRTSFDYDISGGLQSSRQYFDLRSLEVDNVTDLAVALKQTTWTVLPKLNA